MARAFPRKFERWVHYKNEKEYQIIGVVTPVSTRYMQEIPMYMSMLVGMGVMGDEERANKISAMDTTNGDIMREVKVMGGRYTVDGIPEDISKGRYPKLYILYQGLYGEHDFYMREISEFMGKVDKERRAECNKEYRFERKE